MKSQTPQFDALLDKILEQLVPHTRTCVWKGEHPHCEGEFEIQSEDIEFLKMLRVPAPNFCPTCRRMKRFVHMNLAQLSKHKCQAPGHDEMMISILPEECPFPVYDYKYIASDEFDPFVFGEEYQPNKSPLESLLRVREKFPMPSFLNKDPSCINSDYSNGGRDLKNGYYVFGCYYSEDIWYTGLAAHSRDIMDSRQIKNSDHVYWGVLSDHMYKSSFVYFSENCTDSMFLFDCKNCDSCFGCVNLRNAKYCVWNKQLSKEEYENFMASISPLSITIIKDSQKKFWELVKSFPINASRNVSVENVNGVLLRETRNAFDATDSDKSEHIRHADGGLSHKDSMDFLFSGGKSSLLYGCVNIGSQSSGVKFSVSCKFSTNSEFIFNSKNLDTCFMCFGLQNASYCVLNTQYTPEEYFLLVDTIKTEMLKKGEYADGLGMEFSAQAYNFSLGNISFPLSNDEIIKLGGYVAKDPESNAGSIRVLSVGELPQTIHETTDDIINCAIQCEVTGKPFRITPSELEFYRKMKLPLPTQHPVVRMEGHLVLIPEGKKYVTHCAKCKNEMYSIFNPEDNFILYCEKCYQQEVY